MGRIWTHLQGLSPKLSENCFLPSFFPVVSNEVRNLLTQVDVFKRR